MTPGHAAPTSEMDEETAGAVDALGSAKTVGQLAKLMQAAMRMEWRSMSSRAWANLETLESIQRQIRIAFVLLGVLVILIGLIVLYESDQHHADTQATITRIKQAEEADITRVQRAEYHGRIETAILDCRRDRRRHDRAVAKVNRAVPHDSRGKTFTLQLIQVVEPHIADCVAYAHTEIKAPGQHNGPPAKK